MSTGTLENKVTTKQKLEKENKHMEHFSKYGDFSQDYTEFIIKRPDTPRPWINYLTNGRYCRLISQTAGGYAYYLDSGRNRLTRWAPANYLTDQPGNYLYIKDIDSNEFWSLAHQPVKKSKNYECRHGLGYTIIKNEYSDISLEAKYFVPQNDDLEICIVNVENKSGKTRNLKLFPFAEWYLGDWAAELGIRNITILLNDGKFDKDLNAVYATKFPWCAKEWPYFCFIASSLKVDGYDIDYENFIGRYRDYSNPAVVENGKTTNSDNVRGMNMVGVLEHTLTLQPNESKKFVIIVGLAEKKSPAKAKALLNKYRDVNTAEAEFAANKEHWRKAILDNIEVETPDKEFDRVVNVWLKYQVYMNNLWGRSATFYHEGGGEFGYRNTSQDAWGITPINQKFAKKKIEELCYHQRKTGQPLPGWSLVDGPSTHRPPSDFPIWLPFLINAYVKETGDFKFLDKKIDFFDGGSASVYEHAKKATTFLMDVAKSKRGIPLMGSQDWNDAFDRTGIAGKGESVWLGIGLCVALLNMKEMAELRKDTKMVKDCQVRYEKMKAIINKYAWDGDRYIYAFNDFGEPIGSKKNKEGGYQLNSQTWAILAGIAEGDKLDKILKIINEELETPYGPLLFKPAYTKHNGRIGRITDFAPGTKENAAIFCHGGAFTTVADLKLKLGNRAYTEFKRIIPSASGKDVEIVKSEPYVLPEYYIGLGNNRYGEGAFSWLTGSADWLFVAATQWLLGAKPEYNGLRIDPCIPSNWKKARIKRLFRGDTYDIIITNPKGKEYGEVRLEVDGKKLDSNLIVPFKDGKVHTVKAEIV